LRSCPEAVHFISDFITAEYDKLPYIIAKLSKSQKAKKKKIESDWKFSLQSMFIYKSLHPPSERKSKQKIKQKQASKK